MGIESTHPLYDGMLNKWRRSRDSFKGSDDIKARGTEYLPKLGGQTKAEYESYKLRAVYVNAIKTTINGLVGAVMRLEPVIEVPDRLKESLEDITGTGVSLNDFISNMLSEQLLTGRQGILIDRTEERGYFSGYTTEQITNWLDDRIILRESYLAVDDKDVYATEYKTQYRELLIEEGIFYVRIWREQDRGWSVVDEIVPTKTGNSLEGIPFIGISGNEINLVPTVPPLLALVDTGISMYRTSADLEHGRHFTALPTPYVTGIDIDSELRIGSGSAWILPDTASKAGYLEFSGQGLQALEKAVEEKRSIMAGLGAQLLQSQKAGVESADAVRLRQNAETSTLVATVMAVESAVEKALQVMADWDGLVGEINVSLNKDFVDTKIQPADMSALMHAWQSGAISHDTFLWNMKRGEVLSPDTSIEEEKDRIDIQAGEFE